MIVLTEGGDKYIFSVLEDHLLLLHGHKKMMVTDITNLQVGKRMTVQGHILGENTPTKIPNHSGRNLIRTPIIIKILP